VRYDALYTPKSTKIKYPIEWNTWVKTTMVEYLDNHGVFELLELRVPIAWAKNVEVMNVTRMLVFVQPPRVCVKGGFTYIATQMDWALDLTDADRGIMSKKRRVTFESQISEANSISDVLEDAFAVTAACGADDGPGISLAATAFCGVAVAEDTVANDICVQLRDSNAAVSAACTVLGVDVPDAVVAAARSEYIDTHACSVSSVCDVLDKVVSLFVVCVFPNLGRADL
jgi:hypothetical protein